MESLKKKSIIGFILGLAMILSITSLGIFTSKVYAATTIDRIDIESATTSVKAGVLPKFTASTTTEHANIKESDSNNFWVRWPDGADDWEGFNSDTEAAFNDGSTRYGLRIYVILDSGYQFSNDTKIYFNDEDVTSKDYTKMSIVTSGGMVYIDLGLATGNSPKAHTVTFDTDGGTSIESRTIVDGYKTYKPSDPTKKGYIFKGWYTDDTYTTEFNFSNVIKADTTIYAKWEPLILNEIRISSTTTSVEAGALSSFTATTTTEHATIEDYGANTRWLKWKDGASNWSGFGSDYEMAVNDGKTHYGLRIKVNISDDYQFSDSAKVYFNGVDVTTVGHTTIQIFPEWGGYVIIDLGLATGDFVTANSYEELKAAVDGCDGYNVTDSATNHVKLGADITIPASTSMGIAVINDFTLDLNGHTLAITNDNSNMVIMYGSNGINDFTSGSLTITDTSASQTGTINLGIKPIFVYQYNASNTGMHYKLTIDSGKFYGISGVSNHFFEFNSSNEYYWKNKLITFDFKIEKGYFEHISTNMSSIILANDMKVNNVTFNMSFDNLTFKSGNNRLIASNESYSIDDVVPEDTNFYIFNLAGDKQVLITERTTPATSEVPSSLWENKDGYTDTNYYGIKLVKKDGFDVTAPTFDDVNYGYSSVSAKGISIYNRGTSDLQVKSVTVDDTSKFTVTGSTEPTIPSKATDDTSFTIQPVDGLDAGTHTATITVTDMADKTYTATVSFIVKPKDITSTIMIEDIAAVTYNGKAQTPTLVVKDETTELTLTTDYTVSYENNTNRGTAKAKLATVKGSNYTWTGTVEKEFTINPKSITPTIEAIADQYYTGKEIKPSIVVKDGTTVLNSTTDYEVMYSNNINAGSATVSALPVSGKNYTWDDAPYATKPFTILPHTIKDAEVALASETAEYTGSAIEMDVTVTFGETTLVKDTDYTVTYTNNAKVGTATVKVEGKGNYDGTINKNFEITPKTITPVIADITAVTYNGEEQKPTLTVSGNSETLVKDKDYTVSYESNINAGTATAKITAKAGSNYTWDGEVTKDFTINPMTITPTIADITAVTYKGAIHKPKLTVTGNSETLEEGTHYTVAYENNTFAGTATAKITAKVGSNYTWSGTVDKEFTINAAPSTLSGNPEDVTNSINTTAKVVIGKTLDISNLVKLNPSNYPDEIGFTLDTNAIGVTLNADGKTLNATSATGEGTVSLKASFGGWNVDGVGEKEYAAATDLTFYVKVVNKEEVTISGLTDNQEIFYNGSPVSLSGTITVSDDKVPVDELEVNYQGTGATVYDSTTAPTNAGTYTVTYRVADSNTDYIGSVTYSFTIKKVQLAKVTLVQDTFEYTGSGIETVLNDFSGDVEDATGTSSATNVNDYTITVSLKDKENYEWDDATTTNLTLNWSIKAKKLTKPTLIGTYTYNGNEQTATLENFNAATMNVTNNTRTEAGGQDITVSLKDKTNYAWTDDSVTDLTITFEIAKAMPTIAIDNLSQKEGSVTAVTYTVTPATTDGTVKVEYKVSTADDTTYTETLPTTKGTYTVKVSVAGDSNLEDTRNTATLTITKKTTSGGGGGSSVPTKYTITVKQNSNGKISPETVKVEKGEDQTFEIKASEGYEIEDVLVDGKSVGAATEYTFENVKAAHTIEATFKKVEEVAPVEPEDGWKNPFIDVSEKDWFYEAVKFANENNLFNGVSSNEFGTQTNMTRGMIVTVLYRYAKAEASKEATFADVEKGSYYSNAIAWAAENGIVNGVGNNNFAPDKSVTREDFVVILYRYAVKSGIDVSVGEETNILSYEDFSEISEYAIPAFQWACGSGIITGRTSSTLAPKGTATRAEVATMVMRFVNN